MDDLRAMREARYAAATARAAQRPAARRPAPPVAPPEEAAPKRTAKATQKAPAASEELCGHRNMSGRTCTREAGHAAKSHRYS